jgi:hypothetical protein
VASRQVASRGAAPVVLNRDGARPVACGENRTQHPKGVEVNINCGAAQDGAAQDGRGVRTHHS